MGKYRRYIKKSASGGFFLCIEEINSDIDMDKKTKLWLSSDFLIKEAILEDYINANKTLEELIKWNEENERFEECNKLMKLRKFM